MIDQYLKGDVAASRQQDIERKIAVAEMRRQAQASRHADGSPDRTEIVAARWPRMTAIGSLAGACRALGRGLAGVVSGRAPA